MHLTFAYGSAVTRFSDRRIRVRVVPDQEQAGRADGEAAPAAEQASEQGAHGRAATSDAAQQHGLDLEMQPIPEADSQNGEPD